VTTSYTAVLAVTQLYGRSGNDTIYGGDGSDFLNGGAGSDRLYGEAGNDVLLGDDGQLSDDILYGGDGNDSLYGGEDNDRLSGDDGDDNLYGSYGNDTLNGGAGNDFLNGAGLLFPFAAGAITSIGSGEIDVLTGGAGADIFSLGENLRGRITPNYLSEGDNDYALITDFNKSEDVIQLVAGVYYPSTNQFLKVEYSLAASPGSLPSGTAIYADNLGAEPELIAILQGVAPDSVNLSEPYFA
jgi:Ca2+-binding RTX toxin-like protein